MRKDLDTLVRETVMKGSVTLLMVWFESGIYEHTKRKKKDGEKILLGFYVRHKRLTNCHLLLEALLLYNSLYK